MRRAVPADVPDMADVLVGGLGEKVRPAFGRGSRAAVAALIGGDLGRPEVAYWVAEEPGGGRVVAMVHLALAASRGGDFVRTVRPAVGLPRAIWAAGLLSMLAYPGLDAGEAYVEELAVHASARRRGLARALLAACAADAAAAGKERLTLWVGAHNAPAMALYEREGFRAVRRRRSLALRVAFAMPEAVLMARPLPK